MRICIIQSPYIPWRGFFDLIGRCDEYVVYDSAQYVKRHWHNRNRIKTAQGVEWLTIPVATTGRFTQSIAEVEIAGSWAEQHWRRIEHAYRRAPYFHAYSSEIGTLYEAAGRMKRLTDVNLLFIRKIAALLGIQTRIVRDDAYASFGRKTERLVSLAQAAGASRYLSGPSAQTYLDEPLFAAAGMTVEWMAYDDYVAYPQLYGEFEPAVSVLDLLFNTGPNAPGYLKGGGSVQSRDSVPELR